jgi:hypothetical protein
MKTAFFGTERYVLTFYCITIKNSFICLMFVSKLVHLFDVCVKTRSSVWCLCQNSFICLMFVSKLVHLFDVCVKTRSSVWCLCQNSFICLCQLHLWWFVLSCYSCDSVKIIFHLWKDSVLKRKNETNVLTIKTYYMSNKYKSKWKQSLHLIKKKVKL